MEGTIKRGDRVSLNGITGTVEALTKPYAKDEVRNICRNGRWKTVTYAYAGDRLAKVRWDDLMATNRWRMWINTRNLKRVEAE